MDSIAPFKQTDMFINFNDRFWFAKANEVGTFTNAGQSVCLIFSSNNVKQKSMIGKALICKGTVTLNLASYYRKKFTAQSDVTMSVSKRVDATRINEVRNMLFGPQLGRLEYEKISSVLNRVYNRRARESLLANVPPCRE